jgi:hypothetical protein
MGFVAAVIAAGFATRQEWRDGWGDNGLSGPWITVGLVSLIQGIAANVFCKAFADMIRLLKMQNDVHYSGEISPATPLYPLACAECGTNVHQWGDGTFDKVCEVWRCT